MIGPEDNTSSGSSGDTGAVPSEQADQKTSVQAPEGDLGPFKDGRAAYEAWKELQRTLEKREKEYEARIQEMEDTIGSISSDKYEEDESSPEEDYAEFQKNPKAFLKAQSDRDLAGVREEMNLLKLEVRVQRARAKYPDFDALEPEMLALVKKGVVNPAHPDVVEILYALTKARKAEEEKKAGLGANPPGKAGGKESPAVAEGTKIGKSEPDYTKMSLEELERLVNEQPGAKSR